MRAYPFVVMRGFSLYKGIIFPLFRFPLPKLQNTSPVSEIKYPV
nr:MAG TPA: hypothetical protein [Caudoviricetes sp.]